MVRRGTVNALLIVRNTDVLRAAERSAPDGLGQGAAFVRASRPAYTARKRAVLGRLAGVQPIRNYSALPIVFVRFRSRAALLRAANDPDVAGIGRNERFANHLAQSLPLIRQPVAAAAGYLGTGTSVAVLDTGADYTRAAFGSCSAPGVPAGCKVAYAHDFAPDDGVRDDNGHGTNVSGIVVGVAPGAKVLAMDVFNGASASSNTTIAAINFAITNQATYGIRALNMSLGDNGHNTSQCSGGSNPYVAAFANARAAGIMPVVAAGNAAVIGGSYVDGLANPACTPGAMSVGAVYDANVGPRSWLMAPNTCDDNSTAADQVTCFSQGASYLTVLAPGAMIDAAGLLMSGTSQASPHVAGAVAVLAAASPGASLDSIASAIANSGPSIVSPNNGTTKHRFDLPDAIAAVGPATGADLSITNLDSPDPVAIGGTITYAVTVTNNGPDTATGVSVTDTLPASVVLSSAPGCVGTTTLTCGVADLASGASASIQVAVVAQAAGVVSTTATVTSSSADPLATNNTAIATTNVGAACTVSGTGRGELVVGTAGDDVICGNAGSDTIVTGGGNDVVIGGGGFDYVSYEDASSGVVVSLVTGTATGGAGNDTLQTIEGVIGSPFGDSLTGSAGDDELIGLGGSDHLSGGAGSDYVRFDFAPQAVTVNLLSGVAKGEGRDQLSGFESVVGSRRSDTITGNNAANVLFGENGNDVIIGNGGSDALFGGAGGDRLSGGGGNDRLSGGPGSDRCDQGGGHGPTSSC
jgi:uncharacterized repeat protein (TIGR01451 family)